MSSSEPVSRQTSVPNAFKRLLSKDKDTTERRSEEKYQNQAKRRQLTKEIRELFTNSSHNKRTLDENELTAALLNEVYVRNFFSLFDVQNESQVSQNLVNERLRAWAHPFAVRNKNDKEEKRNDFVETIEYVMFLICGESDVTLENFREIFSNKKIMKQYQKAFGDDKNHVEIEMLIDFIMETTSSDEVDTERLEKIHHAFLVNFGRDKKDIEEAEFKKIFPSKDNFFVSRLFKIFDTDGSKTISIAEYCQTINRFYAEGDESKLEFLFYLYDVNDDGKLYKENFHQVLKACMKESGMKLEEEKIKSLADVLFDDGVKEGQNFMSLNDFKEQFYRQEGLISNLNMIIDRLITPKDAIKSKTFTEKMRDNMGENARYFSAEYWSNNTPFVVAILAIIVMMISITAERFVYFSRMTMASGFTPNVFYMFSRAAGKNILYLSVLVITLVLRHTITLLRNLGLGRFLPLDNNIYLHKVVGILIFALGMVHSLCHFLNFRINIQPEPLKYLLMTFKYWEIHFGGKEEAIHAYHMPPGCFNVTENCTRPSGLDPEIAYPDEWLCQVCPEDNEWTYTQWILTTKPGLFGLCGGVANPTGVGLFITMIIIFTCSLPFVRRRGHFEIFYFSHYLFVVYYILLILHAPEFWKWFCAVGVIYLGERLYRVLHSYMGKGSTTIEEGVILPSKVTNLIIKRPANFAFSPGDWVFVRIPRISTSEWHPFTISSAPEVSDNFTLHIRGVGHWTNKLYKLFEDEYKQQAQQESKAKALTHTVITSIRNKIENNYRNFTGSFKQRRKDDTMDFTEYVKDHEAKGREKTLIERKQERMAKRQTKLDLTQSVPGQRTDSFNMHHNMRNVKSVRYKRAVTDQKDADTLPATNTSSNEKKLVLREPLEIFVDGPFGSPSSNITRAEHAVLIGTGIGITPFASILQSIMHRYWSSKISCPDCNYTWTNENMGNMFNLKKVDFFWINRDHTSFEWFVDLLSQLEIEQQEHGGHMNRFLDMHMYVTSALQRNDMKAVALQMALDILHKKEKKDLITGLKSRMNAGRPNWNKVFTKLKDEQKGEVTVFFCGNPMVAKTLRLKCEQFGFNFRKEVF